jgi:hypothetical protein
MLTASGQVPAAARPATAGPAADRPPGPAAPPWPAAAQIPVGLRLAAAGRQSGPPDPAPDQQAGQLRQKLEATGLAARGAASWLESSRHYARLMNRDGFVPLTARFEAADLAFLGGAREQLIGLTELVLRILELHQPLDAGGITTDPASPILRCRSCMWRWPCPTFRIVAEAVRKLQPAAG